MAVLAGKRVRSNSVYGIVADNPLTVGATTLTATGLANLAAVSGDHAVLVIDPLATAGAPEIVLVTAHTAAATTATISRAAYGTTARQHLQGVLWVHTPTIDDAIRVFTSSTRPTDVYAGQVGFETDTKRWVGHDGTTWQPDLSNPPACRVYSNANQSVADANEVTVAFNSERYDTDNMHDNVTNNSRITFNTAGLYLLTFTGLWVGSADYSLVYCTFRLNASTPIVLDTRLPTTFSANFPMSLSTVYKFAAGDYVEVRVYQDNTANAARNLTTVGNYSPEASATWIGVG